MNVSGIWIIFMVMIVMYILKNLFNFYGIGLEYYGPYLAFILFLAITYCILPSKVGDIGSSGVEEKIHLMETKSV
jgi:hypothetical protein